MDGSPQAYATARRFTCPQGHARGRDPLRMVVPDGSGLDPACTVCHAAMEPAGERLTGSWELATCCTPAGPNGQWAGPPRDPRKCSACFGTRRRSLCAVCAMTNCEGTHDFCIDCLDERVLTCPDCDGNGTLDHDDEPGPAPCPRCEGKRLIPCPACAGARKPSGGAPADPRPPAPADMSAPHIDQARRAAVAQADRLEGLAGDSEQLENDLIAGGHVRRGPGMDRCRLQPGAAFGRSRVRRHRIRRVDQFPLPISPCAGCRTVEPPETLRTRP